MSIEAVLSNDRQWHVETCDCRAGLARLPDNSVHDVITSVPYWGLRDYGIQPVVWGGSPGCKHEWGPWQSKHDEREQTEHGKSRTTDRFYGDESRRFNGNHQKHTAGSFCHKCSAWLGSYGLEPTLDLYLEHTVEIFAAVRRVLRPDGVLWLNVGDAYANDGKWGGETGGKQAYLDESNRKRVGREKRSTGLKPKDLMMMPARVALALQSDGWWLRSQCPWIKRNAMPESTTDRPSTSVEYIYLLTKDSRYFYDQEAVKINAKLGRRVSEGEVMTGRKAASTSMWRHAGDRATPVERGRNETGVHYEAGDRNRRNHDWFIESWQGLLGDDDPLAFVVNLNGYKQAHFATFPLKLVEPCIKAGTSERGCCPKCGAQWRRKTESNRVPTRPGINTKVNGKTWDKANIGCIPDRLDGNVIGNRDPQRHVTATTTTGWAPGCDCGEPPVQSLVLDPFNGAGTTGVMAKVLGRRYVGLELNPEYTDVARRRIDAGLNSEPRAAIKPCEGQKEMFA